MTFALSFIGNKPPHSELPDIKSLNPPVRAFLFNGNTFCPVSPNLTNLATMHMHFLFNEKKSVDDLKTKYNESSNYMKGIKPCIQANILLIFAY